MSVTPALAADAISGMQIDSRYVDGAYLLLSYDPGAQSYPNCIPVLKLPVRKAEAKETSPHHVG